MTQQRAQQIIEGVASRHPFPDYTLTVANGRAKLTFAELPKRVTDIRTVAGWFADSGAVVTNSGRDVNAGEWFVFFKSEVEA